MTKKYATKIQGMWELTNYGRDRLYTEGYDSAVDGYKNYYSDKDALQDAASDMAAYHMELTDDGVPEGLFHVMRECAADIIYEGMLAGWKERDNE